MSDRVSITVDDGIADVRLNRPDKLNALDGAMFQAIAATGEGLKGDRSVRVVVLSGEGRGFCAGLDFGSFQAMAGGGPAPGDGHADGDDRQGDARSFAVSLEGATMMSAASSTREVVTRA